MRGPGFRGARRRSVRAVAIAVACAAIALSLGCGGGSGGPPPPPPGAVAAGESIGTAAITGRAVFGGQPPERKPINMSGEAACRKPGDVALSEDLIVNPNGTLRNVWVHVVSGLGDRVFAPPADVLRMDQRGCMFVPHVLGAMTNQMIAFTSSDPVVHNVRTIAHDNPVFNVSMSARGRRVRRFFPKPEIIRVRCDIHAWMSAYIAVSDHPFYAITGEDGAFAIDGLPAGTFEVEAWHESLGTSRRTITLGEGERREIEFPFAP